MITICVYDDGYHRRLTMDGHAGYNPGCDIVCASASALVQSFVMWLDNYGAYWQGTTKLDHGMADIKVEGEDMDCFEMLVLGLMGLEVAYPDHVCVEEKTFFDF